MSKKAVVTVERKRNTRMMYLLLPNTEMARERTRLWRQRREG